MPCLTMREDDLAKLTAILERAPDTPVSVEITGWVQAGDQRWPATLPSSVQEAFMEGRWAPLTELLSHRDAIRAIASDLPYTSW
jgi:3-isopropylmalate/(R)-2-methylmalate dehydratase small subunit